MSDWDDWKPLYRRLNTFENLNCQKCRLNQDNERIFVYCKHYLEIKYCVLRDDLKLCPYYKPNFIVLFKHYMYKLLPVKYREYPVTREDTLEWMNSKEDMK